MGLVHMPKSDPGRIRTGPQRNLNTQIPETYRYRSLELLVSGRRLKASDGRMPIEYRAKDLASSPAQTLVGQIDGHVVPLFFEISSTRAEGLRLESKIFMTS